MTPTRPSAPAYGNSFKLPASRARVWRALTLELGEWFAERCRVDLESRELRFWGAHTLWVPDEESAAQRLVSSERECSVVFDWTWNRCPSRVEWRLESRGAGCDLEVLHTFEHAFPADFGPPGCTRPDHSDLVGAFWEVSAANLERYLADSGPLLLPLLDGSREVRVAVDLDATPERVFRALVEPEGMRQWMGAEKPEVDLRVGGRYGYGWRVLDGDFEVEAGPRRILELEPGRRLVHDWFWPDEPDTRVAWEIEAVGDGSRTRLTLHHTGFDREPESYKLGWLHGLNDLVRLLAV